VLLLRDQPTSGIWRLLMHKNLAGVDIRMTTRGIPERKVKTMDVWPLADYDRHAIWTVLKIAGYTHHVRQPGKIEEVRYEGELLIRNRPDVVEAFGVGIIIACRSNPLVGSASVG
jgi:hypothetical protein